MTTFKLDPPLLILSTLQYGSIRNRYYLRIYIDIFYMRARGTTMLPHKEQFRNRWKGILPHFGLDLKLLNGKHGPCPFCGGTDRFRFTDYRGNGEWICNQCGAGDGFEFVKRALGRDFKEAVRRIEPIAANVKAAKPMINPGQDNRRMLNSILQAAGPVTRGDPVWQYLENRLGPLRAIPPCLKYHPELSYSHGDGTQTFHPAMVAPVIAVDGAVCNLHRTYLTHDGHKAEVPQPKKLCAGSMPKGSAIRLAPISAISYLGGWVPTGLGIAEGIETALAATELTGIPCWAAVCAHGLEHWEPPDGVAITIFGDNDEKFIGQGSAYALAKRLARKLISVDVRIPEEHGDWADVIYRQLLRHVKY
jgi:putative DNA primase/helicase